MVNILSWNARGLGSADKRRALKDFLSINRIDIVGVQETKKSENFSSRTLNALSSTITHWISKPSNGASGGLLLGIDDSKFWILDTWIKDFSITVHVKLKAANFEFLLTVVYGPVLANQRSSFLSEIRTIPSLGPPAWLLFGDFNLIRNKSEKQGPSYNYILSNRFNSLISNLNLIELALSDRKFSWSRFITSNSKALLDRYFCSIDWFSYFPNTIVTSLPRLYSDHNPIILHTESISTSFRKNIKFEKAWISQEGFSTLLATWWHSFQLEDDLGNSWKFKLQFLRRKLRGWNSNFQGENRRNKQHLLNQLENFEQLQDTTSLTPSDLQNWKECQSSLYKIYQDEETHWQQRSRLKYFFEGDLNTKFFHLTASNRKQNNTILSLEIDGITVYDPVILKDHISSYFINLLSTSNNILLSL